MPEAVFDIPLGHEDFASLSASENAWMICERQLPIWSIALAGTVSQGLLLTDACTPPLVRCSRKDKSRIDQYAFDVCGIAVMGEIFSSLGGLSLMESHTMSRAWSILTFSAASAVKCSNAPGDSAEQWGSLATASHISYLDHGFPVRVGHPCVAHSLSTWAAGWVLARPAGNMEFLWSGRALWSVGGAG